MTGSESFFDVLKSKRESQDIEISEICEFTRIHPQYIEAIEKGDFTVLPNVYIRLFLKSYATFIGADPAKALKDYELHTTGKITQSKEFFNNEPEQAASSSTIETDMDSKPQISPKQISSGVGIIFAILLLFWWASRVTQEQSANIQSNTPRVEAGEIIPDANKGILKSLDLNGQNVESIANLKMGTETDALPNKLPLNDNDFLLGKKESEITQTLKLYPPFNLSITTLQETKLYISKTENTKIVELINQVVPGSNQFIFDFTSTINFDFWNSNHVKVTLNEKSIDDYLQNGDGPIRGSYEAAQSQLYLSFYKY